MVVVGTTSQSDPGARPPSSHRRLEALLELVVRSPEEGQEQTLCCVGFLFNKILLNVDLQGGDGGGGECLSDNGARCPHPPSLHSFDPSVPCTPFSVTYFPSFVNPNVMQNDCVHHADNVAPLPS